jgi:glycosyltransferase involved in cell wall biosynthesis
VARASAVREVTIFRDFEADRRFSMDRYADELVRAFDAAEEFGGFRLTQFRPKYPDLPIGKKWADRIARYVSYPTQVRAHGRGVNHVIDHAYAHLLASLDHRRTVVTVHDLIPIVAFRRNLDSSSSRRPYLSEYSARYLRRAAIVMADSEATKRDVQEFADVPNEKIRVVALGVSEQFRDLGEGQKGFLRARLGLPDSTHFLLLITGTQFYKNHRVSLALFRALLNSGFEHCRLVWLGGAPWAISAEFSELASKVTFVKGLSEPEMVLLYNAVDCLLFPSLYEGFGWPPLEAMACGTPVVCSNAASLPEVVGDAALVAGPTDLDILCDHVSAVATLPAMRLQLIERGKLQASSFTWSRTASEVARVYAEVYD